MNCVYYFYQTTVKEIQHIAEFNKTVQELYPAAVKVCESVLNKLSLNGKYMCPGIVTSYAAPVSDGEQSGGGN